MSIDKKINERKNEMYFIALNKDITLAGEIIHKGLDLPVDDGALKRAAAAGEDFDFAAILRNMCLMLGLDADFELNENYMAIMQHMIASPYQYALSLGVESARHKRYIDAIAFFKAAQQFNDAPFESYFHLGRLYYEMSHSDSYADEALKLAEAAFLAADDIKASGDVDYFLCIIYYNLKSYQSAHAYAMKALSGDIDQALKQDLIDKMTSIEDRMYYERGYTAIINGRYQEGLEQLLSISEEGEDDFRVQFFIGVGYRAQGMYQKAIMHLNKSRDLNPARAEVYTELGNCLMSIGDMQSAKDEFAEGIKLFPLDVDLLLSMALASYYTGDKPLAERFYARAQDLDSEHENLEQIKAVLEGMYDN